MKQSKIDYCKLWRPSLLWQIPVILFEAFAKELIHVYVECCNDEGFSPDSNHLMSWCNERIINANFSFYYDFIFTIMLGLKSCCTGKLRNNTENHLTVSIENHLTH